MKDDEFTGDDLRDALVELEITQREFAGEWLGVFGGRSIEHVNRWVNNKKPIPPYIADHVRRLLSLRSKGDGTV